jgi:phosphatidylinositol-3-phosphatase
MPIARRSPVALACLIVAASMLSSCTSEWARIVATPSSTGTASQAPPTSASTGTTPARSTAPPTVTAHAAYSKVMVIVLENHSRSDALAGMPYLRSQAERYGVAAQSYAVTHPSLPNYLAIAGGSTFGVRDNKSPASHHLAGQSIFAQVLAAGGTAKTYAEAMTRNCQTSADGRYVVKHNPWPYFADAEERAACRRFNVPSGTPERGALHDDVIAGHLPTFSMVIPDQCNNAHDCSLKTADGWMRSWLTALKAGPDFRAGRLLVVVTFDEDDHDAGNHILTVFVHPALRSTTIKQRFDQYAVSGLVSRLVGAPPLRKAASATDLGAVLADVGLPADSSPAS